MTDASALDGGVPSLTELAVFPSGAADAAPPYVLMPAFSPSVHDYYVRCVAGANELTVFVEASAGAGSMLVAPMTTGLMPSQTVPLTVNEDDAVVAIATDGVASTEYWVRCLPHDFPELQMVAHPEAGAPTPGYYLVGNASLESGAAGYAMVLNVDGVPVWYARAAAEVNDVDNLLPETISFCASPWEIRQLNPLVAPTYLPLLSQGQHELRMLKNGDYLLTTAPQVDGVNLTGLSLQLADGGLEALGPGSSMLDCDLVELDSSGNVVWRWMASSHLDPVSACTWHVSAPGLALPDGGLVADPYHCNSIDVDPSNGNLLVSGRDMDSIFYVDRATDRILWKMGGDERTEDRATYVPVDDPFRRQHDARLRPSWTPTCSGGSGQITVFDDETSAKGVARAVVYDVHIEPGDGGTGGDGGSGADCGTNADGGATAATRSWQYEQAVQSGGQGSFRILADGSRIIGWGGLVGVNLTFTELDPAGNDVLDFTFTSGELSYRAIKVPLTAFDIGVLRSTTALP
jgi:hypothetical protein